MKILHNAKSRTVKHWAQNLSERQKNPDIITETAWSSSPLVLREYINPAVSGKPDVNWFAWAMQKFVPKKVAFAANLGCGGGNLERHARVLGFQATFDSYDISEGALKLARQEAKKAGITGVNYLQADLDEVRLPQDKYQVIFASMSLHHISNLEALFERIRDALVPGGRLIFNEFIGPRKFQWTDLQLEIINKLLVALPGHLRIDRKSGTVKGKVARPTLEEMNNIDPSEAVLSDQIMPMAHRFLTQKVRRDFGGTILHLLLNNIIGNFHTEEDLATLRRIFKLESICIETGVLPSDFTVAVFEKSSSRD
jgi:SAM-dependent methyltransferase